jgi:hypothetical protein
MTNIVPPTPAAEVLYRCIQCGIESREANCFIGIAANGPQQFPLKCITCTQPVESGGHLRQLFSIFGVFFMPLLFLVAIRGNSTVVTAKLLLAAVVIQPSLVIMHELGHFLTAQLLGLEPSLISIGVGAKLLWRGKILGVPLRIDGWPTVGLTRVGSRSLRFLRLRVWLTVLMGPVTNILLIGLSVACWDSLARLVGADVLLLWMIFNAFLVLINLLPFQFRRLGQLLRSDGLQLLQIPFKNSSELAIYLSATPILSALELFKESDYTGARDVSLEGLERLPDNPFLKIMLSACHINIGDYESGCAVIEPALDSSATLSPEIRAAFGNNLAIGLWLRDFNSACHYQSTLRGDALSDHAYKLYPCVLAYRSTRALLLSATHRPEEALTLLEYMNYERGSLDERANREIARAFALRQLNRAAEAQQALITGLHLGKKRLPWLTTIGLLPLASETWEPKDA